MLFSILYYSGMISCSIQGKNKADYYNDNICSIVVLSFVNSFGGGIIRDIVILGVNPVVFSIQSLPDIFIVILSSLLFSCINKNSKLHYYILKISTFMDAMGLSQFIFIGVDRGCNNGANNIQVFICGVITAVGGGIMSSITCNNSLFNAVFSNVIYKVWVIIGTVLYIYFSSKVDIIYVKLLLSILMFLSVLVCNNRIIIIDQNTVKRFLLNKLDDNLYYYIIIMIIIMNADLFICKVHIITSIINQFRLYKSIVIILCRIKEIR